jgi:peptidyl-prolyl cis-trans isomerase SurA
MTPENIKRAKSKANKIHKQLLSGAKFSNIAISSSNAPNALNGGDMGWRKIAELPSSLVDAIATLNSGQFSKPVRTPTGFHIVQLRDTRNGFQALNIAKTKVRHILISASEVVSKSQAKRTASQVYQRLLKHSEKFAEIAEEYSNDPGSSSQGGDLGWTENGQMVPEFEKVMSSTKVGQLSLPFESRFGWHILQVQDRKTENVTNIAKENQARNTIGKRKFDEERDNWLREIRAAAYIEFK